MAHLGPDPGGGGGMAAVIRSLLASPLNQRYEMEMIVTHSGTRPLARILVFARALPRLVAWTLRRGPRLAHVHSAARGSLYRKSFLVLLLRALRRPVLVQIHAGPVDIEEFAGRIGSAQRRFIAAGLRAATRVAAVSSATAAAIERAFGVAGIVVVPNPAPALPPGAKPREPGVDAEPRVLFLGGFANPVKGGEVMVAATAALAPRRPQASFALAGPGDPPPALLELEAGAANVESLGWLDQEAKERELGRSAVFVLPSISEGLPVALLEAMSWGRAIVATEMGGVPDVVGDDREAVLVPPGDSAALATAIDALLADSDRCQRLGAAAARRAGTLNEEEVCGRLDQLYQEALDG
ncbi:MAG TPA: glycosyltransferase family 4 protein [Solirubrobacterales bacterium]|nr:glycosyltransferase family 4 protein [Solirubrobacterales bacterium]